MNKLLWVLIILLLLSAMSPHLSVGQDRGSGITLQEALEQAYVRNPTLAQSRFGAEAAAFRVQEEQVGYWPIITIYSSVARAAEGQKFPTVEPDGTFRLVERGTRNSMRVGMDVSWPVYDFGKTRHAVEAATFAQMAFEAAGRQDVLEATNAIKQAFYGVQHNTRLDSLFALSIAESQELERLSQVQVAEGNALPIEVLRAQVDLQNARAQQASARGEAAKNVAQLAGLIGADGRTLRVNGDLPAYPTAISTEVLHAELFELALQNRQDVQQLEFSQQQQEALMDLSTAQGRPTLSLEASGRYLGPQSVFGADLPGVSPYDAQVGLRLSFNLLGPFASKIKRHEVEATMSQLMAQEEALKIDLAVQIEQLLLDLDAQAAALESSYALLRQAQANEEVQETEYRNGAVSLLEYTNARVTRLGAEVSVEQARYAMTQLMLQLENVVGAEIQFSEQPLANH